jgi:hypothetical protein
MGIFNWSVKKASRMFGYQRIKEDTDYIFKFPKDYAKSFKYRDLDRDLDIDLDRDKLYKLSKEELENKKKNFLKLLRISFFMFTLFLVLVCYEIYIGSYMSALSCMFLSAMPAVLCIKYHYYYSSIKNKKLINIREYFSRYFMGLFKSKFLS